MTDVERHDAAIEVWAPRLTAAEYDALVDTVAAAAHGWGVLCSSEWSDDPGRDGRFDRLAAACDRLWTWFLLAASLVVILLGDLIVLAVKP